MPIRFRRILPEIIREEEEFLCPVGGSLLSTEEISVRVASVEMDAEEPFNIEVGPTESQTNINAAL